MGSGRTNRPAPSLSVHPIVRLDGVGIRMVAVVLIGACQTVASRGTPTDVPGSGADVHSGAPAGGVSLPLPTVRGLWVVRTTLAHPDSVRAMVQRASEAGFNTLLVQVRGRGDSYYSGGLEPRAELLRRRPAFDPLALTLDEAHRRGLEVHAWINVHLVANASVLPTDPDHIIHSRPDLLAVPRELAGELYAMDPRESEYLERLRRHADHNRDALEGLYSSPSDPEVKERVYDVAMDLVDRYDIDGIHLDYVRYPSQEYDYSRGALARFRSWVGQRVSPERRAELDSAAAENPMAFTEALPGPWAEFRRSQITDLVERVYVGVKRRRPEVVVSAAVFPDPHDALSRRHQDWEAWIREGIVDVVAPMAYTADNGRYEELIAQAVASGGPERVWAGVGTHVTTYRGALGEIAIARRLHARGVILFSYDWAVASGEPGGDVPFLQRLGKAGFGR